MPLARAGRKATKKVKRAIAAKNFHELRHGKTFARTRRKFGVARARQQMTAIVLKSVGANRRRKKRK
jgi:hypothetical protein